MAKLGLVTVLYNSNDVLEGFFKSLSVQDFKDYHLYIIDNSPSLETDDILNGLLKTNKISNYSYFKYQENIGVAKGNNIGIKHALDDGCEFVLLLNNDIEFEQTDLVSGLMHLAEERNEDLIAPKIYFYATRKVWYAGGTFKWWKAMAVHIGEWKDDCEDYNHEGYFDYAPTCFMLIRSSVFSKIGIMDEKYFVYFDDTDFAYRTSMFGYRILYTPMFKILHKVGTSSGGYDSLFGIYYGDRNRIYFIRKHFGVAKKILSLSYFFATRTIKYVRYDGKQRKQLIKGIKDGFSMKIMDV